MQRQYLYNPAVGVNELLRFKFNSALKNILKTARLSIVGAVFSLNANAKDSYVSLGDKLQIGIPVSAFMISLYKEDFIGAGEMAEGALWTAAETHVLKSLVKEVRPNFLNSDDSFPSGHASAAFQGAAFLQMRYGWDYGLPAYAAASFVGYSRVRGGYHYWHDVIAGAALAIGTQYVITEMGYSLTHLIITPTIDDDYYGLQVSVSF
jgi:membrane-associated phospholipid phosphatase